MRLPVLGGLLPMGRSQLGADALAGMTLVALAVPEVLGYARIAGMPVVTGLYTMLVPMAVFALLASSRHLVVAADSATAAILAAGLVGVARVIVAQSAATSRAYAANYDEVVSEDLDLVGLAGANLSAAFTSTFVVNGSPTKTQMVDGAGGRSQLSQLTAAVVVLLVVLLLTGPLT